MSKQQRNRRSIDRAIKLVVEGLEQRRLLASSVSLEVLSAGGAAKDDTAGAQTAPAIAFNGSSGVMVWTDNAPGLTGTDIGFRRFDAGGFTSDALTANSATGGNQQEASVAVADDGTFVIVWNDTSTANNVIRGQRFAADGQGAGSEFAVSTNSTNAKDSPDIAMAGDGKFVVTWNSNGQDTAGMGVIARRFDADGTAASAEFVVNTTTAGDQENPSIAMADSGAFVIAFENPDTTGDGISMQRFNAAGAAAGSETLVNTTETNNQTRPSVANAPGGAYVVTWQSTAQDGSGEGVYFQRFSSAGAAQGSETRANTTTTGNQQRASIAVTDAGAFTIAWADDSATPDRYVARAYNASGTAVTGENPLASNANINAAPNIAATSEVRFVASTESSDNANDVNGTFFRSQLNITTSSGGQVIDIAESLGGIVVTEDSTPDSFPAVEAIDLVGGSGADTVTVQNGLPSTVTSIRIDTGGGNDTVTGSDANERVDGAAGSDSINAAGGNDTLYGSAGDDTINGGDDNDRIDPGTGTDSVSGGNNTDTLTYQTRVGEDLTVRIDGLGNSGAVGESDTVAADFENAVGGDGDDLVIGNGGNNVVGGADGNDTIDGGLGEDTLFGDNGNDTVSYESHTQQVNVTFDSTNNDGAPNENDELHDFENITGSTTGDRLTGDGSANVIDGGGGDDVLDGGAGADTLIGGAGANDTVTYASRTNTVSASINGAADDGESGELDNIDNTVENLTGGSGDDDLVGDGHNNILDGGAGADALVGNNGNDRLIGRDGDDTFDGGHGADVLYGHGGVDSMFGGPGRDKIFAGDGNDRAKGGSGDDSINGENGNDQLYGDTGADSISGGSGNDNAIGGSGNDTLEGNAGDDKLYGENGSDTLNGGTGADRMDGGLSSDSAFKDELDRLFSVEHIL